jgi:hypothetical protein
MKKIFLLLMMSLLIVSPASAKMKKHKAPHFHHVSIHKHDRTASGILGAMAGFALADAIYYSSAPKVVVKPKPKVYIVEPERKCYTIVSRKTGSVSQKCVESSDDEIIYVD